MGGNASPDIANLYCYSVEAAYVDAVVQAGEWEVVAACCRITRYIDDFLCFGSTPPPAKLYGMAYSCTSSPIPINYVIDLDYIGLRLRLELGEVAAKNWVRMGVANKARKWNFRPVRFPMQAPSPPCHRGPASSRACAFVQSVSVTTATTFSWSWCVLSTICSTEGTSRRA